MKAKSRTRLKTNNRPKPTGVKSRHQKRTTRVTVDFPEDEHRKLKAMAALQGVTLQEYIRSHVMEKVETTIISDAKFQKLMGKILDENEDALRRLADK